MSAIVDACVRIKPMRSIDAALPLLTRAERVTVLVETICDRACTP
jgi:hypothetical protein